jgi:thiamine pyrophosphokinase
MTARLTDHALIFANGDMNDGPTLQHTLASAPGALVVAADGGARLAQRCGLAVDTVIGDMDSLNAEELVALERQGAEIQRYPEEKNETDLELALKWVAQRGVTWIRVIGGIGDRLDQTLSNVYLLALPELVGCDARLVAGTQAAWVIYPGETVIHGAKGDTVSLIPLGGTAQGVRTENLYYPLVNEPLFFGPARGLSNVMQGEVGRVWLREGLLLVIHTLGRA